MQMPAGFRRVLNVIAAMAMTGGVAFPHGAQARDIIGVESSLEHPGFGITPGGMQAIFREAECGYPRRQCNLFDDFLEADAHARSLFEKRTEAVAPKPSIVQAGGSSETDKLVAAALRAALAQLPMVDLFEHLLSSCNKYGWGAAEVLWDLVDGDVLDPDGSLGIAGRQWVVPVGFDLVASRRFRIVTPEMLLVLQQRGERARVGDLRILVDVARIEGDALEPGRWIVMRRPGDLPRAGLMRTGAWNCLGKRLGYRDWLVLSEKYGLPTPIAKYKTQGEHADDKAVDIAEQIIRNIGNDGGAVVPDTIVELDLVKAFEGDGAKMQGALIAYCNRENSKLVNGSTLANDNGDSGGASYALGDVHDSVRWEAVQYDAEKLQAATVDGIFVWFVLYNGFRGRAAVPKHVIVVVRDLTPKAMLDMANVLTNELGVPTSVEQLRTVTGWREPSGEGDRAPGIQATAVTPLGGGA